jgi:arginase family enzyme
MDSEQKRKEAIFMKKLVKKAQKMYDEETREILYGSENSINTGTFTGIASKYGLEKQSGR